MEMANAGGAGRIAQGGGRIALMTARPDFEYDDEISEEGSDESQDGFGEEDQTPIPESSHIRAPPLRPQERQEKRQKVAPTPRAIVDEYHIVQLVKAYRSEFAAFCKGKKKAPRQMIPNKVWEKIYKHYTTVFPHSVFEEQTLKKHLREQLAELGTGIADDGQRPVLQDEDIATEVRGTDCSATRNILRLRQTLVTGVNPSGAGRSTSGPSSISPGPTTPIPTPTPRPTTTQPEAPNPTEHMPGGAGNPWVSSPGTHTTPTRSTPTRGATSGSTADSQRHSKADMLNKQAEAVCLIAQNYQENLATQASVMNAKGARHRAALLKEARDNGVIDEAEYKERLRGLLNF